MFLVMIPRAHFLQALFQILDRQAVPYCVLRNYANIYENTSSDVDVAVEPEHVLRFKNCLAEAAAASSHHLVLRARYVNYSYVYWHEEGGFIRIDLETEVRWHVWPVLTAKSIVGLRHKTGDFYIPHPRHESAIIWVAAVWRAQLSDRYRNQLARLYQQAANPAEFQRTFTAVFGAIGPDLTDRQSRIASETFDRHFWSVARWSIVRNAFRDQPCRRELFNFVTTDLGRIRERIGNPRGISILYASAAKAGRDLADFFRQIEFLYPTGKSEVHTLSLSSVESIHSIRLGLWLRVRRLFVLFKGGLFMRSYHLSDDADIPKVSQSHTRYLFPSRTFVWAEDSRLRISLGHVETGFMTEIDSPSASPVSNGQVIRFIAAVLEHYPVRNEPRPKRRGAFIVLTGSDPSVRNAVARELCAAALPQKRFYRVRYLHWPPHFKRNSLFPFPEPPGVSPAESPPASTPPPSRLPITRVCRNLIAAILGYWLRLRPLLRRNSLVLFDGYDYECLSVPGAGRNSGLARVRTWLLSLYPRPDLVVCLDSPTPSASLKQAHSGAEALRPAAVTEQHRINPRRILQLDASQPAPVIAREILQTIATLVP